MNLDPTHLFFSSINTIFPYPKLLKKKQKFQLFSQTTRAMDRSNSVHRREPPPQHTTNGTKKTQEELLVQEEDESIQSIERIFESKQVPSWQSQLTLRAFCVSLVLGILFTFIVMKLNLTTGIIPSLNVSAGLLGFFFVKTWTKFLEKSGFLKQPFTRQENTVIQTCVVATSGIAFSGK